MNAGPYFKQIFISKLWACFFFSFIFSNTQAQLCTGSLGDPVVNITFGNGSPIGPPLDAAVTSYRYVGNDCPNDGTYTVRSSTSNCFGSWQTITADHTGDPQGRFMLVNASFDPGDFYVETVRGLCANTTYEFAAWLMNMVRFPNQIRPNITFTIEKTDGTVLGLFHSGDIDISGSPEWKKYGFNFKTPPGVFDIVLRMKNNAPGGIGNDIALDDITFRPCGPKLTNTMEGSTDVVDLCEGDSRPFTLQATVPPFFSNPVYQWQLSENGGITWKDIAAANTLQLTVEPEAIGAYWYRFSAAEAENFSTNACRIVSNITVINIHSSPAVSAGSDKVVIKGGAAILQGSVAGTNSTHSWSPSIFMNNGGTLTPSVTPDRDITYTLSASSEFGCTASDDVFVKVISGIHIPTSFTPNGDGLNDGWRIPYIEYAPDAEVKVFNRYGSLIYQSNGKSVSWDGTIKGKPQPAGVYVYLVSLKKGSPPIKGFITLIR